MRRVSTLLSCILFALCAGCSDDSSTGSAPEAGAADVSAADVSAADVSATDAATGAAPLADGELAIVEPGGETICSRGTDFRFFAVGGESDKIILDFAGGGACWNEITCSVADAIFRPDAPSKEDIEAMVESGYSPGFYDLDNPDNPFLGWTLVHIPYCLSLIHISEPTRPY